MRHRVLVLGGSGFVGAYLVEELSPDFEVVATSSAGSATLRALDIRDTDGCRREILEGAYETVVNCVTRRSGTFTELFEINVRALADLLPALADAPLQFVQMSSLSGTPENRRLTDYGLTKFMADEIVRRFGAAGILRTVSLRFGQLFDLHGRSAPSQPGLHQFVSKIRARQPIDVFAGTGARRSYLPVPIAARAVRRAIARRLTGIHDVVSSETYTPFELATRLAEYAGWHDADIRIARATAPFEYAVPECSPEFSAWLEQQDGCAAYFRRLMQHA